MMRLAAGLVAILLLAMPVAPRAEESLVQKLEPLRARHGLPALAAAVTKNGTIVARGAVGVRVHGTTIPVTPDDRFHIGSDTKAMTATLAGILVDQGKLRWDSTIGEVLGAILPGLKPAFAAIKLEQLLSHTSGIPSDNDEIIALYVSPDVYDATLTAYRLRMISAWNSKHEPKAPAGAPFQYSNFGYVIAGAMVEQAFGEPWESLITTKVFEPLGLKSAGLGPQATFGKLDAAIGHDVDAKGKITPRPWGPGADVPAPLGPAGIAHMSVGDFATWAAWNAGQGRRGPAIVQPETLKRLHSVHVTMDIANPKPGTPKSGGYAFGWGLVKFDWSSQPLLTHNGSNSMNLATILVDTGDDIAIVVMTNFPGAGADTALLDAIKLLYEAYGPKSRKAP